MADFVSLTCPSCGGRLELTEDIDRFACAHCGVEHVVRRSGSMVSLKPVVEGLARVQTGVDKTASELAIRRLTDEIRDLQAERERVRRRSDQVDSVSSIHTMYGLGALLLLFAIGLALAESWLLALVFGASGLALIAIARVNERNNLSKDARVKKQLVALDNELSNKRAELEHHQKIVSL